MKLTRSVAAMSALLAGGLAVDALTPTPRVHAAGIVVNTTAQGLGIAGCSLQEAILAANADTSVVFYPDGIGPSFETGCAAGSGDDVIHLTAPATYVMNSIIDDDDNYMGPVATPMITSSVTIEGAGAVLQRATGAPAMRAFVVGSGGALDLREVHVQGFAARGGNGRAGGGGGLGAGGAIYVHASSLLVQWSTFQNNTATGGSGSTGNQFVGAGGGGGGLGGHGGRPADRSNGGGGGGSRGDGGEPVYNYGGGGGGTMGNGDNVVGDGGYRCGGAGGDANALVPFTGEDGGDGCAGGGGGGGAKQDPSPAGGLLTQSGTGGTGGYGGGGGGGGWDSGDGGQGGFGGGGGAGPAFATSGGGGGGDGGFGGGGGAGPGGDVFGEPGDGGTFAGNATDVGGGGGAGLGGAIFGHASNIEIVNSTFTGNAAVRGVGGGDGAQNGADAGGAIFTVAGELTIRSSTIAGNESTGDGAGVVVYRPTTGDTTTFTVASTIVAGNTGHDECFVLGGVQVDGWDNLVTPHPLDDNRTECPGITQTGDPLLQPLALNPPGRTPTMALSSISPAIDKGGAALAPLDDQRGIARPQFNWYDIGAVEFGWPSDTTAPVAAPTVAPPPNANGWNNTPVIVTWNWSDEPGGSGIDSTNCTTTSTGGTGGFITFLSDCSDFAGNVGKAQATANTDFTPPTVTCATTPTFVLGDTGGVVTATVVDPRSGPVTDTASATLSAADVASVGVRTVNVTGEDLAGNTTTVACPYAVSYAFLGLLEPIPQASYKRGSTIPVRFKLGNAAGAQLSDAAAAALLKPTCLVRVALDGVDQGCVRYVASSDTFQFDVKTAKTLAVGQHTLRVTVGATDGSGLVNDVATTIVIR